MSYEQSLSIGKRWIYAKTLIKTEGASKYLRGEGWIPWKHTNYHKGGFRFFKMWTSMGGKFFEMHKSTIL